MSKLVIFLGFVFALAIAMPARAGDDPFADAVISFAAGTNPAPGYSDPTTVLGSPERFTGEGIFPGVVSPFSPPFGLNEIVSIGAGGHIVISFQTPVTDDPNNLYGIDLIIFGNTGFIDSAYPSGIVGGLFSNDGGTIEVSADGTAWHIIPKATADGAMPTMGFVDSGPYDVRPGSMLTSFTRPVDPGIAPSALTGVTHAHLVQMYRGSGGGTGIDLADAGLAQISFVRIANPAGAVDNVEVDGLSDVAPRQPGDVNLDGSVDVNDLLLLVGAWGVHVPGGPPADFNLDGVINVNDLLVVIGNWGS